jgi:hypothetical protein
MIAIVFIDINLHKEYIHIKQYSYDSMFLFPFLVFSEYKSKLFFQIHS